MKPQICLLPGLDGTGLLFKPVISYLDKYADCIVIEYRGATSFEELLAEYGAQIPGDRRVSLVAESFSGPAAVALMAAGKLNIGASVLSATFARYPMAGLVGLATRMPEAILGMGGFRKRAIQFFGLDKETDAQVVRTVSRILEAEQPAAIKQKLKLLAKMDVRSSAVKVMQPVLYLQPAGDRLVPEKEARILLQILPNARIVKVDGPHMILQSRPAQCARLILQHLASEYPGLDAAL